MKQQAGLPSSSLAESDDMLLSFFSPLMDQVDFRETCGSVLYWLQLWLAIHIAPNSCLCKRWLTNKKAQDECGICPDSLPRQNRKTIFGTTFNVNQQLTEVLGYITHPDDGLSNHVYGFALQYWKIIQYRFRSRTLKWSTEVRKTRYNQGLMWQIVGRHVSKSNAETGTSAPNTLVKISTPKANQTFTQPNPNKIKKDILVSPSCSKLIDKHWY